MKERKNWSGKYEWKSIPGREKSQQMVLRLKDDWNIRRNIRTQEWLMWRIKGRVVTERKGDQSLWTMHGAV